MYREYGQVVAVTNRSLTERPFLEQIRRVCEMHPDALILREKDLSEKEYEELAKKVMAICAEYQVPCILHTFWRVAEKLKCDTVHLPLPILRQFVLEKQNQNINAKAQTGMGKTEGGLWWIGNHKGYFVLPLRTAINAIYDRVCEDILENEN